jgi:mycofactocin biosynthetic radical S-adenosylmethionine protein MftC
VGWSRDWHADLPLAVALEIIEEGALLFPMLHLTGGEPFAYRGLFTLLDAGVRQGYGEILINTNGTLLTPPIVERLRAYRAQVSLSVSLDGPAAMHDRVRGAGQFELASRAVTALLAARLAVTVMTVVTPEVLGELSAFVFDLKARFPGLQGVTLRWLNSLRYSSRSASVTSLMMTT